MNLERAMGAHVRFGGHFVQASITFKINSPEYTHTHAILLLFSSSH